MEKRTNGRRNSYTNVISIYILICIAGLIISIPIFNGMINRHDMEISNDICGLIAEKMNNSITYITESVRGRAEIVSSNDIDDWNDVYNRLSDCLNAEGCNSIGLIDNDKKLYGKANEAEELDKWGLIDQAHESKSAFISPPYRQGVSGEMVFTIFAPITQNGIRAGELFMTFELSEIQKMANSNILEDDMEIYLMNPFSNNYIGCFGLDRSLVGSWNNSKLLYGQIETEKGKTYAQWEKAMRNGQNGEVVFFKMDGVSYTQIFVNIDVMEEWNVVVRVPNAAFSSNLRVFHFAVIVVIVILIISLFVLFVLSNRSADAEKKKLEYLSVHDPLTTLANRRAFESIYNSYLIERKKNNQRGALIFFDIDFFKQVNDQFGHAMGDRVLREFADIATQIFNDDSTVSRFGGDEFIILIHNFISVDDIENRLIEFRSRLKALDFLKDKSGNVFSIHFSAGIVEVADSDQSLEDVERKADKALYKVKKRGRDGFEWYKKS